MEYLQHYNSLTETIQRDSPSTLNNAFLNISDDMDTSDTSFLTSYEDTPPASPSFNSTFTVPTHAAVPSHLPSVQTSTRSDSQGFRSFQGKSPTPADTSAPQSSQRNTFLQPPTNSVGYFAPHPETAPKKPERPCCGPFLQPPNSSVGFFAPTNEHSPKKPGQPTRGPFLQPPNNSVGFFAPPLGPGAKLPERPSWTNNPFFTTPTPAPSPNYCSPDSPFFRLTDDVFVERLSHQPYF